VEHGERLAVAVLWVLVERREHLAVAVLLAPVERRGHLAVVVPSVLVERRERLAVAVPLAPVEHRERLAVAVLLAPVERREHLVCLPVEVHYPVHLVCLLEGAVPVDPPLGNFGSHFVCSIFKHNETIEIPLGLLTYLEFLHG
jgi:hypothetical protein